MRRFQFPRSLRLDLALAVALSAVAPALAQAPVQLPPAAPSVAQPSTAPVVAGQVQPPAVGYVASESFDAWRQAFVEKAVRKGFERAFVEGELAGVTPDPRVLSRDNQQPEFSRPIGDYMRGALTPKRLNEAREKIVETPHLREIEQRSGVPAEVLVGIWAMETDFGRIQGEMDVIRDFATLAWDGRRRDWAETQLLDALTILRDHHIPRAKLKGSWAGAMGQTQFIPQAYLELGRDGDGDGVVDLWGSAPDALASAANLLAHEGWRPGQSWAVEASLPAGFDYGLADGEKHTPAWWADKGVRRADGRAWSAADAAADAVLIAPAGARGPAFFAFPNHFVIRKYNNSTSYALGVGLIADAARGVGPLTRDWPYDTPLSLEQRMTAQSVLVRLGFLSGKIDGVIGSGTRQALKAWQKARGITPDGYLTVDMVNRLKAEPEAGVAGAPPQHR